MSGDKIFIDTNICIYLLNGDTIIADLLNEQSVYISFITEIELYSYHAHNSSANSLLDSFMQSVNVVDMSEAIKRQTIAVRKEKITKLPDAIIAASALVHGLSFLTADKGFRKVTDLNVLLYAPR